MHNTTDPDDVARRMAAVVVDRVASDGSCTQDDLLAAGFTALELVHHLPEARRLVRAGLGAAA